jgi:uncharacterized lipoprotein YbaY
MIEGSFWEVDNFRHRDLLGAHPTMKMNPLPRSALPAAVALLAVLLATTGCIHLDLTPQGDSDRVLTGTINLEGGSRSLPDDAVVLVRVEDAVPPRVAAATQADPTLLRPPPPADMPPEVLGEQLIKHPGSIPLSFSVEYQAEASRLEHGLNVEVRISYGGRVQYINRNSYAIGLNDAAAPHSIWVSPVTR